MESAEEVLQALGHTPALTPVLWEKGPEASFSMAGRNHGGQRGAEALGRRRERGQKAQRHKGASGLRPATPAGHSRRGVGGEFGRAVLLRAKKKGSLGLIRN